MAFEAAKRWVKDQFVSDPQITQRPKQLLDTAEQVLPRIPAGQRMQAVEYIRQYANAYYVGRHNHAIPQEVVQRVHELETRARRLDTVDRARAFLEKYGPPERALAAFMTQPELAQKTHFETAQIAPAKQVRQQRENQQQQGAGMAI
jgi:hypothetical protein